MRVIVVGAGIIGASIAWRLAQAGAEVTVVDADVPGGAASGRSFGWINASFHQDAEHFRLRNAGIAAWHRAEAALGADLVDWCGALCWEEKGPALDAQAQALADLGYRVEVLGRAAMAARLPAQASVPEKALWFPTEGATDAGQATQALLRAATTVGARLIAGCPVTGLTLRADRITGVETPHGRFEADCVVIAAGTGASKLIAPLGLSLPLPPRPGLILRTAPLPPILSPIIVTPDGEVRQDRMGRLLMPVAAGHQGDRSETLPLRPDRAADAALVRLRDLLPEAPDWAEVTLGWRPVPEDGLPAVGPCGPTGLWLAVMHSGVTLAALIGELVAQALAGQGSDPMLARYSPARFQTDGQLPGQSSQSS